MNIYFLVRHLGEKSILLVFSLTCWGLTGLQHISTTLTILHYLDLKVAAWVTCFRCTYFEIMLEGATMHCVLCTVWNSGMICCTQWVIIVLHLWMKRNKEGLQMASAATVLCLRLENCIGIIYWTKTFSFLKLRQYLS